MYMEPQNEVKIVITTITEWWPGTRLVKKGRGLGAGGTWHTCAVSVMPLAVIGCSRSHLYIQIWHDYFHCHFHIYKILLTFPINLFPIVFQSHHQHHHQYKANRSLLSILQCIDLT